jgi:acyl-CoA reductase-like NAD-dependent aldehyde dehydrogenase
MRINREEVFGPVAASSASRLTKQPFEANNNTPFGSGFAGVATTSPKEIRHAFQTPQQAGMVMVNLPTAGGLPRAVWRPQGFEATGRA